ncbi:MAG: hypothetical protein COB50_03440 [Thiotrichales bacterium]|nr:MAG: hypothetical protein COB50_03440 [Thiotrichales bacterium]
MAVETKTQDQQQQDQKVKETDKMTIVSETDITSESSDFAEQDANDKNEDIAIDSEDGEENKQINNKPDPENYLIEYLRTRDDLILKRANDINRIERFFTAMKIKTYADLRNAVKRNLKDISATNEWGDFVKYLRITRRYKGNDYEVASKFIMERRAVDATVIKLQKFIPKMADSYTELHNSNAINALDIRLNAKCEYQTNILEEWRDWSYAYSEEKNLNVQQNKFHIEKRTAYNKPRMLDSWLHSQIGIMQLFSKNWRATGLRKNVFELVWNNFEELNNDSSKLGEYVNKTAYKFAQEMETLNDNLAAIEDNVFANIKENDFAEYMHKNFAIDPSIYIGTMYRYFVQESDVHGKHKLFATLHKYYTKENIKKLISKPKNETETLLEIKDSKLQELLKEYLKEDFKHKPSIKYEVRNRIANISAYCNCVELYVKRIKSTYPAYFVDPIHQQLYRPRKLYLNEFGRIVDLFQYKRFANKEGEILRIRCPITGKEIKSSDLTQMTEKDIFIIALNRFSVSQVDVPKSISHYVCVPELVSSLIRSHYSLLENAHVQHRKEIEPHAKLIQDFCDRLKISFDERTIKFWSTKVARKFGTGGEEIKINGRKYYVAEIMKAMLVKSKFYGNGSDYTVKTSRGRESHKVKILFKEFLYKCKRGRNYFIENDSRNLSSDSSGNKGFFNSIVLWGKKKFYPRHNLVQCFYNSKLSINGLADKLSSGCTGNKKIAFNKYRTINLTEMSSNSKNLESFKTIVR